MGDSEAYFLCNMSQKVALAKAIDNVHMSLKNRYARNGTFIILVFICLTQLII